MRLSGFCYYALNFNRYIIDNGFLLGNYYANYKNHIISNVYIDNRYITAYCNKNKSLTIIIIKS